MMRIILLGAPGAGKGTLAERINDNLGYAHISTGDIFRRNMRQQTPIGLKAKEYIDKGMLVPDEVTIELVKDTLVNTEGSYMLDGFPRTTTQALALDGFAEIDLVLDLVVDFSVLLYRITGRRSCLECGCVTHIGTMSGDRCPKCGKELIQRRDDTEEVVKSRLNVYTEETAPLIEFYKKQGKLIELDGMTSPDEVWAQASKYLK